MPSDGQNPDTEVVKKGGVAQYFCMCRCGHMLKFKMKFHLPPLPPHLKPPDNRTGPGTEVEM